LLSVQLFLICIGLCIAYYNFSSNIDKYFYRQLIDETRRVKITFVIFLVSYTSRAISSLVFYFKGERQLETVYLVLYPFWEVLPFAIIMKYHHFCFAAQEKYLRE